MHSTAIEITWQAYCRTIALGTSHGASSARLCSRFDGDTPSKQRAYLGRQLEQGRMLGESYRINMDAIDDVEEMWNKGTQTHVVPTPSDDWLAVHGGHMRRTHLGKSH